MNTGDKVVIAVPRSKLTAGLLGEVISTFDSRARVRWSAPDGRPCREVWIDMGGLRVVPDGAADPWARAAAVADPQPAAGPKPEAILADARADAERITAEAQAEAACIVAEAKAEAMRLLRDAQEIRQTETTPRTPVPSGLAAWVGRLLKDPDQVLKAEGDLFTTGELLNIYDPRMRTCTTANKLGRELHSAGILKLFDGRCVRTSRGVNRYYVVRDKDKWAHARPKDARAYLDTRYKHAHQAPSNLV